MVNRFSRQVKIKWFDQKKISNCNCMIVGCGGIGTWTAIQLTMLGIRKLILVDMDLVEESNLNRQFYYEEDINKYKVTALQEKLQKINSKLKIMTFTKPIQELSKNEYKNIDFVFDCLDNIPTREYLAKLCWDNKIPFIHSACSDVIGEVQLVVNKKTKPMREYPPELKESTERKSCKDFDLSVCTTNMIVASLQVDKFLNYLLKKDTSKPFVNYIRNLSLNFGE